MTYFLHTDEKTLRHSQEDGGDDLPSLANEPNQEEPSSVSFSITYFHFTSVRLQIFTFTKILWVIASEAAGEIAVTVMGISPKSVGLTGKTTVAPS